MKRIIALLLLIPSLAFSALTEFYCDATNGNNNFSGSSTNASPYTKTAGNYVSATRVYTVQDGTNPSSSVSVGDYCSVYNDGAAAPTGWVSQVTAVQNAVNGTITMSSSVKFGNSPTDGTANRTIVCGGPWKGPNAASGFPFSQTSVGNLSSSATAELRINMKNNATYSITAAITPTGSGNPFIIQGYSSTVGDGGKATIDGGTSVNNVLSATTPNGSTYADLIFKTSFTSSSGDLVLATQSVTFWRCVFTGSRGNGYTVNAGIDGHLLVECESYGNNTSNTAGKAGFWINNKSLLNRCIAHDNTGSNTDGFFVQANGSLFVDCISDTNGRFGLGVSTGSNNGPGFIISNCDFYNNGSDGINIANSTGTQFLIENCNFIKNAGAGINNAVTTAFTNGYIYNCGYGAGTQANTNADTIRELIKTGTVTYASNVTPWVDPANGNFSINLGTAQGVGRGTFTQTAASYTGTVGFPDIGAAQAQVGATFPTPTPTPTTPPENSHTFGG